MSKGEMPLKWRLRNKAYRAKMFFKNAFANSKGDRTMAGLDFKGKKAIVFGIATDKSIGYAIAKKLNDLGCKLALGYQDRAADWVKPLLSQFDDPLVGTSDACSDEVMGDFYKMVEEQWGEVDYLIHSIAFAKRQHLQGRFIDVDRRGWQVSQEVSAFSLPDFLRRTAPMMKKGGSCVSLTFMGSERVFPNYNVMGVAKAALEASVRYAAHDLGPQNIRVNAISAGPIPTLAASAIAGFDDMLMEFVKKAPLRRLITQDEVANTALFLLSDMSSGITGEVIHVDGGYNIMGI
ncbi:MAG TPA: enoyl-ACP reductase [Candidatus Nanoarchaeia archaeon]|nr:enoyl-ACP reductase [Candidatus Nanoarchaeia archaeon]